MSFAEYARGEALKNAKNFKILLFLSLFVFVHMFCAFADELLLPAQEAQALIERNKGNDKFVILDLRSPDEYRQGHIKGARSVNYYATNFQRMVSLLDRDATILLYCQKGRQSTLALRAMTKLGFSRMYILDGGIDAWVRAGLPLPGP